MNGYLRVLIYLINAFKGKNMSHISGYLECYKTNNRTEMIEIVGRTDLLTKNILYILIIKITSKLQLHLGLKGYSFKNIGYLINKMIKKLGSI